MKTTIESSGQMHSPAHPGEILKEMYMTPLGVTMLICCIGGGTSSPGKSWRPPHAHTRSCRKMEGWASVIGRSTARANCSATSIFRFGLLFVHEAQHHSIAKPLGRVLDLSHSDLTALLDRVDIRSALARPSSIER